MIWKRVQEQLFIKMQNMGTKIKEELIAEMRAELKHETMMYFAKMSANIGIHSLLFFLTFWFSILEILMKCELYISTFYFEYVFLLCELWLLFIN